MDRADRLMQFESYCRSREKLPRGSREMRKSRGTSRYILIPARYNSRTTLTDRIWRCRKAAGCTCRVYLLVCIYLAAASDEFRFNARYPPFDRHPGNAKRPGWLPSFRVRLPVVDFFFFLGFISRNFAPKCNSLSKSPACQEKSDRFDVPSLGKRSSH